MIPRAALCSKNHNRNILYISTLYESFHAFTGDIKATPAWMDVNKCRNQDAADHKAINRPRLRSFTRFPVQRLKKQEYLKRIGSLDREEVKTSPLPAKQVVFDYINE